MHVLAKFQDHTLMDPEPFCFASITCTSSILSFSSTLSFPKPSPPLPLYVLCIFSANLTVAGYPLSESAIEQAKDEAISDQIRTQYKVFNQLRFLRLLTELYAGRMYRSVVSAPEFWLSVCSQPSL